MTVHDVRLEERLRGLAAELRGALEGALRSALAAQRVAAPDAIRPLHLTSHLGLDKSLASRVVRSLGAEDDIEALHGIPTPQGLGLIARALRKAGADGAPLDRLTAATEAYAALLSEFSGGRTDLEAALAGWLPDQRRRAERDARRSVFRGMTTLVGARVGAIYNALLLVPSAEEGRVDSLIVAVRQDLRRLRAGARVHVARLDAAARDQRRSALDGAPLTGDPHDLIIEELCSQPLPGLTLEETGERLLLEIAPDSLDVNESTTLGIGWRTRGHFAAPGGGARMDRLTVSSERPCETLVLDVLVHASLGRAADAVAATSTFAPHPDTSAREGPPPPDAEERAAAPAVERLEGHPSGMRSPAVRAVPAILENACREAGFAPDDFTSRIRATRAFPVPTEHLTLWWRLERA